MVPNYISVCTIIGGGVYLLISLVLARKCFILSRNGIRSQAVVVGSISDGEASYPIVEFVDLLEIKHQVRLPVGGGNTPLGKTMGIIYHRENPKYILGTSFVQFWLFPLSFFVGGSLLVLIGVLMIAGLMGS